MKFPWQLQKPLDAIIFDCDGTLSYLEGIDELAEENGVGETVKCLTADAMGSTGVSARLYEERLRLVKPTKQQVARMGELYYQQVTPDIQGVIEVLQALGKRVFVVSAGIQLAVEIFAKHLDISSDHVYAVTIKFDDNGRYLDFDRSSPLTRPGGKGELAEKFRAQFPELMHVGDGLNDLDAQPYVRRFVGYGGAFFRESILKRCEFYIRVATMSPLLALALTVEEVDQLNEAQRALYDKGLGLITESAVSMAD